MDDQGIGKKCSPVLTKEACNEDDDALKQQEEPVDILNARGMPARIRKRNRYFYDNFIVYGDKRSPSSTSSCGSSTDTADSPLSSQIVVSHNVGKMSKKAKKKEHDSEVTKPRRGRPPGSTKRNIADTTSETSTTIVHLLPADKELGRSIGFRLRNLLKLPKAHKWVIFEWFYSFIDKPLFSGDNDFQRYLNEHFPHLRTRQLRRAEWQRIRSLMGKPRRCSSAFFAEERLELARQRQKIRFLQTLQTSDIKDMTMFRTLPDKIPYSLPVGTKVTARLRAPPNGIFSGTVDAFDSQTSTYRVTFDRKGLGTFSIPDYEVVSENFFEMLSLQSIAKDFRRNLLSSRDDNQPSVSSQRMPSIARKRTVVRSKTRNVGFRPQQKRYPLFIKANPSENHTFHENEITEEYPPKLLELMVQLKKMLIIKYWKIERLNKLNNEAELKATQQSATFLTRVYYNNANNSKSSNNSTFHTNSQFCEEFQRRYASLVISLEKINNDIKYCLNAVQAYTNALTQDPVTRTRLAPSYLREKCRETAELAVERNNQGTIKNKNVLALIKKLATVLSVASNLRNDGNSEEVTRILEGCIEEVKSGLHGANLETFKEHVELRLDQIQSGILPKMWSSIDSCGGD